MEPHTPPQRSPVDFLQSVRASYKTINTERCTVSPKQGLINEVPTRTELDTLFSRPMANIAFAPRAEALLSLAGRPTRRRRQRSKISRGYDGSPGRQHSNHGP